MGNVQLFGGMPVRPVRFSAVAIAISVCLSVSAAYADGMPFKNKPEPAPTSLDKALDEIQNKEPPIDVTAKPPEPPKEEPAPVMAAPAPIVAPVPEARVVEVQPNTSFFGLSVGMYDPFSHGQQAGALTMQYEPGVKIAGVLQPLFGALVTTNGALMGYGGVGLPIKLSQHVRLMPSVAVGAYKEGAGFDLGQTLAYRAGAELAYIFDDQSRVGLNFHILTNGKSLSSRNRTEVIGIAYTRPFNLLSGRIRKPEALKAAQAAKATN
jgi:lipid A 3-O-deacylase